VHRERYTDAGVGAADLLQEKHVGQKILSRSAELLRHAQPHESHICQLLERLRRETVFLVQLGSVRCHFAVGELRRSLLDFLLLFAEFEIHKPSI
jgi:hypothetical protein